MQGQWLRGTAYYRCRFPDQYASANKLPHPRNVYLREDQLVAPLDDWLLTALAPAQLEATIEAMYASQHDNLPEPCADSIQQIIEDCDRKIANYRALLDAGTDSTLVAGWIAETTAERVAAEAQQRARQAPARGARLSRLQIRELITAVGDIRTAIRRADAVPAKTAVYQRLGIRLVYLPAENSVRAEANLGPDAISPDVVGIGSVSEGRHLPDAYAIRLTGLLIPSPDGSQHRSRT